jgi:hypothetical protein
MLHNGDMPVSKKVFRQSISLPADIAQRVQRIVKSSALEFQADFSGIGGRWPGSAKNENGKTFLPLPSDSGLLLTRKKSNVLAMS